MDSPTIPQYLYDIGVTAVERVGNNTHRPAWRVDLASGESKMVWNMRMSEGAPQLCRDAIVSRLGLGRYGPPPVEHISLEPKLGYMVRVDVRQYVPGVTLAEMNPHLSDIEKARLACQLYDAIVEHGSITSGLFGALGDTDNAYDDAYEYLRTLKDTHLCNGQAHCRIRRMRTPRGDSKVVPTLCHNSLTADHIIVHSGNIVAIVGWSRCSFSLMQLQAASYAYRLDLRGDSDEWLSTAAVTIINIFSTRRDRILEFCMRVYRCRLHSYREGTWLDHYTAISQS